MTTPSTSTPADAWNLKNPTPAQLAIAKYLREHWSGFDVEWDVLGEPGKRILLMSAWDILKAIEGEPSSLPTAPAAPAPVPEGQDVERIKPAITKHQLEKIHWKALVHRIVGRLEKEPWKDKGHACHFRIAVEAALNMVRAAGHYFSSLPTTTPAQDEAHEAAFEAWVDAINGAACASHVILDLSAGHPAIASALAVLDKHIDTISKFKPAAPLPGGADLEERLSKIIAPWFGFIPEEWKRCKGNAAEIIEALSPVPAAEDVRERVAELCHAQWSGWMKHLFGKCDVLHDGEAVIPAWAVDRWKQQMATPYSELSDQEKDSDRAEADRFITLLSLIVPAHPQERK